MISCIISISSSVLAMSTPSRFHFRSPFPVLACSRAHAASPLLTQPALLMTKTKQRQTKLPKRGGAE